MVQLDQWQRYVRPLAGVCMIALGLTSCSSGEALNTDQRAEAQVLIAERVELALIELSDDDRACVVDDLTPTTLEGLRNDQVEPVADAVVSCVGDELIGASVLRSQTGEISPASLDCAVGELDRRFLVDLVAGAMNGTQPQTQSEIEVARVLAICLDLDELL